MGDSTICVDGERGESSVASGCRRSYAAGVTLLNRRVMRFFALAFALTWVWWLPMLTRPDSWQPLHYIGSLGPMLAAFILTARERGGAGIRNLLARMSRLAPPWLLLAVALPVAWYLIGVLVSWALGQPINLRDFFGSKEYPHVGLVLVPIEILFFGYGEEVGWRGYALEALQNGGASAYIPTTVLAVFWAAWHVPLFFYSYGLSTMSPWLIPGWLLSLLFGAYLATWLYLSSGRSLLVVAVFHGVIDLVSITPASSTATLVTVNAGLIAAAVVVVVRTAPALRTGNRAEA
jgi:hypothetical protein